MRRDKPTTPAGFALALRAALDAGAISAAQYEAATDAIRDAAVGLALDPAPSAQTQGRAARLEDLAEALENEGPEGEARVLARLRAAGDSTADQLAKAFGGTSRWTYRALDRLERTGTVGRVGNAGHWRAHG